MIRLLFMFSNYRDPDKVKMCILREDASNDISVKIQHTLIEAYCWENDISVQKVGPDHQLSAMLANNNNLNKTKDEDQSCALVIMPRKDTDTDELSEDESWIQSDLLLPG